MCPPHELGLRPFVMRIESPRPGPGPDNWPEAPWDPGQNRETVIPTSSDSNAGEPTSVKLRLDGLSKSFGQTVAVDDLSLDLHEGRLMALLGPSGCGKTTTLRLVAGLEQPTAGEILIGGVSVATKSKSLPPEKRRLGMVFQSYALWPHMSVAENVAYALVQTGYGKENISARVAEVLGLVGMSDLASRSPSELSGGQQQRVAVARALATSPRIILFDEPLSNLDAVLRESMRFEIRRMQKELGLTALYVTHSQEEAFSMADVVAVMKDGRLQQLGTPEELYHHPANRFVAGFVGAANLLRVPLIESTPQHLVIEFGMNRIAIPHPEFVDASGLADVSVAVRPESIDLEKTGTANANGLAGTVREVTFSGNLLDYFVEIPGLASTIRVQTFPPAAATPGDEVEISVDPNQILALAD